MSTDVYEIVDVESVLPDGFYFLYEVVDESEIGSEMLGKESGGSGFSNRCEEWKRETEH